MKYTIMNLLGNYMLNESLSGEINEDGIKEFITNFFEKILTTDVLITLLIIAALICVISSLFKK